jgi:2-amino-4-hydroxy-6-hydroxymethyldihydropteridine diphosphokinase
MVAVPLFSSKGAPPPPPPGRRSALPNVAVYSPRRHPLYRRKIVLKSPQWGIERHVRRNTPNRPTPNSEAPKYFLSLPSPVSGRGTFKKERVFVGVGSNVGGRLIFLRRAARALAQIPGVKVFRASPVYETSPVGPRQRDFLNAVLELRSSLGPDELLQRMQRIESVLGRRRRKRWGPREIDLDLIFFGQRRRRGALNLPHPRWKERKFVVWPLADIAPSFASAALVRRKLTDPDQCIKLYPRPLL